LFVLVIAAELAVLIISSKAQLGTVNQHPTATLPMYLCILQNTWPLSYLYWLPFLAFETVLFSLALIKGVHSYRDKEIAFAHGRAVRAMEILLRDSILYFMLIFTVFLVNTLFWVVADGRFGEVPVGFCVAVSSVMSQRLLLNIRENFEERRSGYELGGDESFLMKSQHFTSASEPGSSISVGAHAGPSEVVPVPDAPGPSHIGDSSTGTDAIPLSSLREMAV